MNRRASSLIRRIKLIATRGRELNVRQEISSLKRGIHSARRTSSAVLPILVEVERLTKGSSLVVRRRLSVACSPHTRLILLHVDLLRLNHEAVAVQLRSRGDHQVLVRHGDLVALRQEALTVTACGRSYISIVLVRRDMGALREVAGAGGRLRVAPRARRCLRARRRLVIDVDQLLSTISRGRRLKEKVILHLLRLHHVGLCACKGAIPRRRIVNIAVKCTVPLMTVAVDILRLVQVLAALGHILILEQL